MNTHQSSQILIDSELFNQVVKLKVELEKYQLEITSFKQMESQYKKLNTKNQLIEKQLIQYQQIMNLFFQRVKKFMLLLEIDTNKNINYKLESFGNHNDSISFQINNQDSISFTNLKTDHNPSFSRKVNKLNSLKTIAQSYLSNKNMTDTNMISFYEQDYNFSLIQARIRSLLKENSQLKRTLDQYQKSCVNISMNIKENEVIVKKLQSELRNKETEIQQSQNQIVELLKKIEEMKEEIRKKQDTILKYEQQQQHLIKTYEELSNKIEELKGENNMEEEKKIIVRNKCQQLLGQLQTTDDNYLLNYLAKDPIVIKSVTQQSTPRSFNYSGQKYKNIYESQQWSSQSGRHHPQQFQNSLSNQKNKLKFVFD